MLLHRPRADRGSKLAHKCIPYNNADKTELLWAGSKHGSALLGSSEPSLQLGAETIKASDHVRLLRVTISSDLSLDKHVSIKNKKIK